MELIHIIFWVFALLTCASALVVALSPRLIHSVFGLFFCFVGTAGLYVLLGADFLAATQVIIYIGGILVLMIFGVMLTNRFGEEQLPNPFTHALSAGLLCLLLLFLFWSFPRTWAVKQPRWTRNMDQVAVKAGTRTTEASEDAPAAKASPLPGAPAEAPAASPSPIGPSAPAAGTSPAPNPNAERLPPVSNTTNRIGEALLTKYLIPFELASLVLLIAMLGAASIARKEIR